MLADCRHADSKSEDLLQLADVVAGVVRRAIMRPDRDGNPAAHRTLDRLG
jgi:hypothetical protein